MAVHIRTKIITSFSITLTLLTILGFIAWYNRNILFHSMMELEDNTYKLSMIANIQLNIDRVLMPPNDYLITGNVKEKERFMEIASIVDKDIDRLVSLSQKEHIGFDKKAKKRFEALKEKAGEIFAIEHPVGNKKGAILMKELDAIGSDILINYLDKSLEVIIREVKARTVYAGSVRRKVDAIIAIGVIVSLITIFALIAYLSMSILKPILAIKDGAFIIGKGNLNHRINIRDGIEMNLLADEFNMMTERLKESYAGIEKKVKERTKELNELNSRLQELSITDGLTGAFNHRYFYEKLTEEMKRAERYCHSFSIIMSDIDHFKHYNDTNGHVAGDTVLKEVASCIRRNVRDQDMVARYGGEEFSVILPETVKKEAVDVAERIRRCMMTHPFPHKETQPGGNLTISLGVAAFPDDAAEPKDLIEKADGALYRAKELGRNTVKEA